MKSKRVVASDVITLLDNKSYLQQEFFNKFALDSVETMVFYKSFGDKAKRKYTGWFYKWFYEQYYKYVHTAAVKVPLMEIEKLIESAESLSVGPCPCRLIEGSDDCEDPLYCCIRVNRFSDMVMDMQNKALEKAKAKGKKRRGQSVELSKERALELVRYTQSRNMIFSLETCISPYANNICCCCSDCCIELKSRYEYGLNTCPAGPYIPKFVADKCIGCGLCAKACTVNALQMKDGKPVVNLDNCLGCGNCYYACKSEAVGLELVPSRVPDWVEPGTIKLLYIKLLARTMFAMFRRYKKTLGKDENNNMLYHNAKPRKSDIIHKDWYEEEQHKMAQKKIESEDVKDTKAVYEG